MSTHKAGKYIADLSAAWLHILVLALIIFVLGISLPLRVGLFIIASVFVILVMRPSGSQHSSHT